jgi:hypothetical protein
MPTMKALEFQSRMNSDRMLTIPDSVLAAIPSGETVRVLILFPEGDTEADWEPLDAGEIGQRYADTDSGYDPRSGR